MSERIAVYPGSFDPPTWGHISLASRGLEIFDRIIVAVARNPAKAGFFSLEDRLAMLRECLAEYGPRITVSTFEGLLVKYAVEVGAKAILRGLRANADFEYEFQMALVNRHLEEGIQSLFMMTDYRWLYISSSIVKEAASLGGDVSAMVPPPVARRLYARLGKEE
jgi:pantetheine-phosphate adenylyltransferase